LAEIDKGEQTGTELGWIETKCVFGGVLDLVKERQSARKVFNGEDGATDEQSENWEE